jgi:hypothetical protein
MLAILLGVFEGPAAVPAGAVPVKDDSAGEVRTFLLGVLGALGALGALGLLGALGALGLLGALGALGALGLPASWVPAGSLPPEVLAGLGQFKSLVPTTAEAYDGTCRDDGTGGGNRRIP